MYILPLSPWRIIAVMPITKLCRPASVFLVPLVQRNFIASLQPNEENGQNVALARVNVDKPMRALYRYLGTHVTKKTHYSYNWADNLCLISYKHLR